MSPEKDPVCGMNVPSDAKLRSTFEGKQYVFCSPGCKQKFVSSRVPHHESAVAMSWDAFGKAEHHEIKMLAQQIVDARTKEIDQMKKWGVTLGKGGDSQKH